MELDLGPLDTTEEAADADATVESSDHQLDSTAGEQEAASSNLYQKILQDDIDNLLTEPTEDDQLAAALPEFESDDDQALADTLVPASELEESTEKPRPSDSGAEAGSTSSSIADRFANKQDRERARRQKIQWSIAGLSVFGIASRCDFLSGSELTERTIWLVCARRSRSIRL